MAFVAETSTWEEGVYQIEIGDPVSGGEEGIANVQPKQLANRTVKLRDDLVVTNLAVAGLQSSFNQLSSDVQDSETDIGSIRDDIVSIQNNYSMQGIEAEQFFFAIAF